MPVSIKWWSHDQLSCAPVNYLHFLNNTGKRRNLSMPRTAPELLIQICMQHGTLEFCCVFVTPFFMQDESWTNFFITLYYLTVPIPSEIRKRSSSVRRGQTRRHTILRSTWASYLITCAHLPNPGIFGLQRKLLKLNDTWRECSPWLWRLQHSGTPGTLTAGAQWAPKNEPI